MKTEDEAVRDISPLALDGEGRLKVVPSTVYAGTTSRERYAFGSRHGFYSLPTLELVAFVRRLTAGRRAIEIGAGNGIFAAACGITPTDSRMQDDPRIQGFWHARGQATVPYGAGVERLDAREALAAHEPDVVVSCWVTHEDSGGAGDGSCWGVDEDSILDAGVTYVMVGNLRVHAAKRILRRPHAMVTPPWLYSRARGDAPNFIAVWNERG